MAIPVFYPRIALVAPSPEGQRHVWYGLTLQSRHGWRHWDSWWRPHRLGCHLNVLCHRPNIGNALPWQTRCEKFSLSVETVQKKVTIHMLCKEQAFVERKTHTLRSVNTNSCIPGTSHGITYASFHQAFENFFTMFPMLTTKKTSELHITGPLWGECTGDRSII